MGDTLAGIKTLSKVRPPREGGLARGLLPLMAEVLFKKHFLITFFAVKFRARQLNVAIRVRRPGGDARRARAQDSFCLSLSP